MLAEKIVGDSVVLPIADVRIHVYQGGDYPVQTILTRSCDEHFRLDERDVDISGVVHLVLSTPTGVFDVELEAEQKNGETVLLGKKFLSRSVVFDLEPFALQDLQKLRLSFYKETGLNQVADIRIV